jgi:hypothetical protein
MGFAQNGQREFHSVNGLSLTIDGGSINKKGSKFQTAFFVFIVIYLDYL